MQMKSYIIKNTDLLLNGKLIPEGSTINLDDKDAVSLEDYLIESKPEPLVLNSFQDQPNANIKNQKRSK
jgi:hypothetical protein